MHFHCAGLAVPIVPFLKGQAFDSDAIRVMAVAFENVRITLGLKDRQDAATEIIAAKIIELAQTGERNPETLGRAVLKSFKLDG